mmetsp:Transcript_40170/g.115975  ORF Transcript_40170/g.115975 Transcript_40170/m.115975 type:complete len:359 (-) Transcript_40170:22-1098(-)
MSALLGMVPNSRTRDKGLRTTRVTDLVRVLWHFLCQRVVCEHHIKHAPVLVEPQGLEAKKVIRVHLLPHLARSAIAADHELGRDRLRALQRIVGSLVLHDPLAALRLVPPVLAGARPDGHRVAGLLDALDLGGQAALHVAEAGHAIEEDAFQSRLVEGRARAPALGPDRHQVALGDLLKIPHPAAADARPVQLHAGPAVEVGAGHELKPRLEVQRRHELLSQAHCLEEPQRFVVADDGSGAEACRIALALLYADDTQPCLAEEVAAHQPNRTKAYHRNIEVRAGLSLVARHLSARTVSPDRAELKLVAGRAPPVDASSMRRRSAWRLQGRPGCKTLGGNTLQMHCVFACPVVSCSCFD